MYLLHTKSLRVESFQPDSTPPYAILSHTWGPEEATYQDLQDLEDHGFSPRSNKIKKRKGFIKVKGAAQLAASNGYDYIWIDTCCIDKSSSAELSEAINSMYRWYKEADVCYVFLSDVAASDTDLPAAADSDFRNSRWFNRGWTLQELIAPARVEFYSREWTLLGLKSQESYHDVGTDLLSEITGIDKRILNMTIIPQDLGVAERMSWAASRDTSREEDIAYCLLGIFGVNMPLLYGEGKRAFLRLQDAILQETDDQSLFAWRYSDSEVATLGSHALHGLLAPHPRLFEGTTGIRPLPPPFDGETLPSTSSSQGLHVQLYLKALPVDGPRAKNVSKSFEYFAILDCSTRTDTGESYLAIKLRRLRGNHFARIEANTCWLVKPPGVTEITADEGYKSIYVRQNPIWVLPDFIVEDVQDAAHENRQMFVVDRAYPEHRWDPQSMSLKSVPDRLDRVQGVFHFHDPTGEYEDVAVFVGLRQRPNSLHQPWALQWSWSTYLNLTDEQSATMLHNQPYDEIAAHDAYLPSEIKAQEIKRHGRNYISLRVMKREEMFSQELAQPEKLPDRSVLQHAPESGRMRTRLQRLLAPVAIELSPIAAIFDFVTIRKIKACPSARSFEGVDFDELAPPIVWESTSYPLQTPRTDGTVVSQSITLGQDLLIAARKGETGRASLILSQGISPEVFSTNFYNLRPLHWAALFGRFAVAKLLLQAGADVTSTADGHITPLHLAAIMGHEDIVDLILSQKHSESMRVKLLAARTYETLNTPLHLAAMSGLCTRKMLKALSTINPESEDAAHDQADNRIIFTSNLDGALPLHWAALHGNSTAVRWFCERKGFFWNKPYFYAALGGSTECLSVISAAANGSGIDQHEGDYTPLLIACREGHDEIVAALLKDGADVHAFMDNNYFNIQPIHIAAVFGHLRCLEHLVAGESNVNSNMAIDEGVVQPLHLAAAQGHLECVQFLVRNGADPEVLGSFSFKLSSEEKTSDIGRTRNVELQDWSDWAPPVIAASMAMANGHFDTAAWLSSDEAEELAQKSQDGNSTTG